MIFFSKSVNGFFDSTIHTIIPDDAVEISDNDYQALMSGQAAGKQLSTDSDGHPILIDLPSPTLSAVQAAQTIAINNACQAAIVSGIQSSALGSLHTYPTQLEDQQNLTASVTRLLLPNPPAAISRLCADTNNEWAYRPHTTAQIQQVGIDVYDAIQSFLEKSQEFKAQIAAATTVSAVQAIVWK